MENSRKQVLTMYFILYLIVSEVVKRYFSSAATAVLLYNPSFVNQKNGGGENTLWDVCVTLHDFR